jgi:uncharacterized lipoprotein NlpE involved in copper resistance
MKKLIFPLMIIVIMVTGCKNNKKADFTLLGDGTPYFTYPEKLLGHVQKLTEKNYWGLPDGDSFKKGNALTKVDHDTTGWDDDIEVTFDNEGNLVSCSNMDEKGKSFRIYKVFKDKDGSIKGENYMGDTLNYIDKYKLDKNGARIGFNRFSPKSDTINFIFDVKTNPSGDSLKYLFVNSKGEVQYKFLILFNASGQFIRSEYYDKENIFQGSNEVKHNDKGKISEFTVYDKDRKITFTMSSTYTYDSKGNWIKSITKTSKNFVVITERTYTYF